MSQTVSWDAGLYDCRRLSDGAVHKILNINVDTAIVGQQIGIVGESIFRIYNQSRSAAQKDDWVFKMARATINNSWGGCQRRVIDLMGSNREGDWLETVSGLCKEPVCG